MEKTNYLILAPTPMEVRPLAIFFNLKKIAEKPLRYTGNAAGKSLVLVESNYGSGFKRGIEQLLTDFPADQVILVGAGAALDQELTVGQVFLINRFYGEAGGPITATFPDNLKKFPRTSSFTGAALADSSKKIDTRVNFPEAALYDQEDYFLASTAQKMHKEFLIIRGISDVFSEDLPPIKLILRHFEKIQWLKLIHDLITDYDDTRRLLKFRSNFLLALTNTATTLSQVLQS